MQTYGTRSESNNIVIQSLYSTVILDVKAEALIGK